MNYPFLKSWLNAIHRRWIRHFDEIWIPDFESDNLALAGKLSRANEIKKQVYYLGPLSALSNQIASNSKPLEFDILFLLSGPEPQRSILEKKLRLARKAFGEKNRVGAWCRKLSVGGMRMASRWWTFLWGRS